ncbi:hypothetical protein B0H50_1248 [Hallerella porci]|uniref:Uncharacterized protein n=2 Tax=Fibrobacteraceae TaxID=204431 RepID=A0ABX5LIT6_9BACT|nr:hypothetical protein B0H50_1248 [Hallerella porci]
MKNIARVRYVKKGCIMRFNGFSLLSSANTADHTVRSPFEFDKIQNRARMALSETVSMPAVKQPQTKNFKFLSVVALFLSAGIEKIHR